MAKELRGIRESVLRASNGLAGAGWSDQKNIGLGQFHVARLAVQKNSLVMIVNRHGELFLGFYPGR